jgi:CBS domain-containing protein
LLRACSGSILTEKVARRGYHIMRELSVDPVELAQVRDVMVADVDTLPADVTVGKCVQDFGVNMPRDKAYPVVGAQGRLAALVTRANVLSFVKETSRHGQTLVAALGGRKLLVGYPDEPVSSLTYRMVQQDIGRVPIVDPAGHRLVGLVACKDLLRVRARLLSEERKRRRMMAFGRRRQLDAMQPTASLLSPRRAGMTEH